MTKAEFIAQVAAQAQLTKAETEKIFNALIQGMINVNYFFPSTTIIFPVTPPMKFC